MRTLLATLACLGLATAAGAPRAQEPAPRPIEGESAVLLPEETLEDLAMQRYSDAAAAGELRALNGIPPGAQPAAGQRLKLPGRERRPAVTALGVARQELLAARQQGASEFADTRYLSAEERLQQAGEACARADYAACQARADEGFALARLARQESLARRRQANRFAVSVEHDGGTRVEVLAGDGVEVTAQAQSARLRPGQGLVVKPGSAPAEPEALPDPPRPLLPYPDSRLITPGILFTWEAAPTAERYVLLLSRDATGLRPVRQLTVQDTSFLFQSRLPNGVYFWFLRAVDARGAVGPATPAQRFNLQVQADQEIRVEPQGAPGRGGP